MLLLFLVYSTCQCSKKNTLLRVIPTMTCWVGVVRLWLSSSFIPWTKRKTSNGVEKVRWKRPNISKAASPASFFSGFLHGLVVSCLLLRIALVRRVQVNRSQPFAKTCQYTIYHLAETNMPKHATTNMPNHVRIPPVKNKDTGIKHGSIPPEAKSKAIVAATAHAQITNALQCVTRSILCTKHAKSCQDTTCQHISRINRRRQTCQ